MNTTVGLVSDIKDGVYIGRPRAGQPWGWGNPFMIGQAHPVMKHRMSRAEVVEAFERWLAFSSDPRAEWMRDNIHTLKGKHLKCFCKPQQCHGDVLAKYAERT